MYVGNDPVSYLIAQICILILVLVVGLINKTTKRRKHGIDSW